MKKYAIILIIWMYIMISTFSMALSFYVISNFSSSEIYTITQYDRDIEISIVIMIDNTIVQTAIFIYLWKKNNFNRFFQNNSKLPIRK